MGIRAIFDAVRTQVVAERPTTTMRLTAEAKQLHADVNRIVWYLPEPGQEQHSRDKVLSGPGPGSTGDGVLWDRLVTCQIHCWVDAVVDSDGLEYPDDNENPTLGTVWLPAIVQNAIHDQCHGGYSLGSAGYVERTSGNKGFAYVFEASFDLAVYRVQLTGQTDIETVGLTGAYE